MNMSWGYMKREDILETAVNFIHKNKISKAQDYQKIRKGSKESTPSFFTLHKYGIKWSEITKRHQEKFNLKVQRRSNAA